MVSVNDNAELVIIGGFTSSSGYVKNIWKYTYPSDSWKIIGSMNNPRSEPASFHVEGIECP